MQRGNFATKICEIATKFSFLIAKCDWIFLLISSPALKIKSRSKVISPLPRSAYPSYLALAHPKPGII